MSLSTPPPNNSNIFYLSQNNQGATPQSGNQSASPAKVQPTVNSWTDTVTPHILTRQADGRLHFAHVDNIALSAYALQSGERESRGVQDRPLGNNQSESVFNVSSKKTDPLTGHQVQATRRYLVQWREFPIQETWEKALTQPGYPPLKVVANPLDGGWTVEANDFLRAMAQSIYFYRGGPEVPPVDKETGLRRQGELLWADIDGQLFPVAEEKKTVLVPFSPTLSNFAPTIIPQQSPLTREITEYFIKTPPDKNIADWPPLPVVRDSSTGKWTQILSPVHINSLLELLGNAGLYGIGKQQDEAPGYTRLQAGKNLLHVANNITVKLPGVTLPAAIHHRGRLPPVPLSWDPLHKRYYILSDPQAFTPPTFTERESWGIRLMVLGIMVRDPIHSSVDLIKAMSGDAAAQERLGQLIQTGVSAEDSSTGGKIANIADGILGLAFFAKSPKGAANIELMSWIATAIGKALLKQEFTVEELLSAYQSLQNLRYSADIPLQGQAQPTAGKTPIPGLHWLESKVVDAPALLQDRRYTNLWRHPEGKLYLKEPEQQLQYLPLIEENSQTFSELRPADKGEGRHFTAGNDGQLREMTAAELEVYRAEQPTVQELSQRNFQLITFTHRDGSPGRGYTTIDEHAVKEVYLFDPSTRSFRLSGKSVAADGRVIGLAGGINPLQPGTSGTQRRNYSELEKQFREPRLLGISTAQPKYPLIKIDGMAENIAYRFRDVNAKGESRLNIVAHRVEIPGSHESGRLQIGDGQYPVADLVAALKNNNINLDDYQEIRVISPFSADIARELAKLTGKRTLGYQQNITLKGTAINAIHNVIATVAATQKTLPESNSEVRMKYGQYVQSMPLAERNSDKSFYIVEGHSQSFSPPVAKRPYPQDNEVPAQAKRPAFVLSYAAEQWFNDNKLEDIPASNKLNAVAQQYVTNKTKLQRLDITLEQLANYYGFERDAVEAAIKDHFVTMSALSEQAMKEKQRKRNQWFNDHQLTTNHGYGRGTDLAKLYLLHRSELEALNISRSQLSRHYGIGHETLNSAISRLSYRENLSELSAEARQWLTDNAGEMRAYGKVKSVAQFYLQHKTKLEQLDISLGDLAIHYNIANYGSLLTALWRLRGRPTLPELSKGAKQWLKDNPIQQGKAKIEEVAQLFIDNNNALTEKQISRDHLAQYYELDPEKLAAEITKAEQKNAVKLEADGYRGYLPARPISLKIENNAPLLVDATGKSITAQVMGDSSKISMAESPLWKAIPQHNKSEILNTLREVVMTDGAEQDSKLPGSDSRYAGIGDKYLEIFEDENQPELGRQVRAKTDIPPYSFLSVYRGRLHNSLESLSQEMRKVGTYNVNAYLYEVPEDMGGGVGKATVSAFGHGNKVACINTPQYRDGEVYAQANVAVLYAKGENQQKGVLPVIVSGARHIKQGETLWLDYGASYNPSLDIQTGRYHGIIAKVAQENQCYFIIKNQSGKILHRFGPDGNLLNNEAVIPPQANKYLLVAQNVKNALVYDPAQMHNKKLKVILNVPRNDEGIYYALAKVLNPGKPVAELDIQKIKQLETPQQNIGIKQEPENTDHPEN
jgi:hypothetical protein